MDYCVISDGSDLWRLSISMLSCRVLPCFRFRGEGFTFQVQTTVTDAVNVDVGIISHFNKLNYMILFVRKKYVCSHQFMVIIHLEIFRQNFRHLS